MDLFNTMFLAQLLGVFTLILGVSMLLKQKMLMHIYEDFFKDRALVYFAGMIEVAAGALLVLKHNIWAGNVAKVVTILGWFLLLEGLLYMFASQGMLKGIAKWMKQPHVFYVVALGVTALGVYLLYISGLVSF
jgi:hypothetical protein